MSRVLDHTARLGAVGGLCLLWGCASALAAVWAAERGDRPGAWAAGFVAAACWAATAWLWLAAELH